MLKKTPINKKLYVLLLGFFIFIFLFPFISSACNGITPEDCDYYINDTDNICLYPNGYTYVLNLSDVNAWTEDPISSTGLTSNCDWRLRFWYDDDMDELCLDTTTYYMSIPYSSSYPTMYTYGEILILESGTGTMPDSDGDDEFTFEHLLTGTWYNSPWSSESDGDDNFGLDVDQRTSCGFPYPTAEAYYNSTPPANATTCTLGCELNDSLVFYATFNESSGNLTDWVNGNDCTPTGVTYQQSGVIDYAYQYSGGADYVTCPSTNTILGSDPSNWTYNMWFKTSSTNDRHILSAYPSSSPYTHTGVIRIDTNQDINSHLFHHGYTGKDLIKAGSYADNSWHMATITISKDLDNYSLYVDGVYADSDVLPYSAGDYTTANPLYFATYGGGAKFDGYTDEIGVWTRILNFTEISDLYNSGSGLAYPFNNTTQGGGGGGSNVTCPTSDICWLNNLTNPILGYDENGSMNISSYIGNWYDWCIKYIDPLWPETDKIICTGYGTILGDWYELYAGAFSSYDNLGIESYYKQFSTDLEVLACDNQSAIDTFCLVAGFPTTCNISAFYTDNHCLNGTFTLIVSENYTYPVIRNNNFSLYYYLDGYENQTYSMWYYYQNFDTINISFVDPLLNGTQNLSCELGDDTYTSLNGTNNYTIECTDWNVWFYVYSYNISQNITIYVNASNDNNTLSDYFIVLTGNYSETLYSITSIGNFTTGINFTSLGDLIFTTDNESADNIIIIIMLLGTLVFFGFIIMVPMKFNKFSIFLTLSIVWLLALWFSIVGWLSWGYVLIPPVMFISYFVIKMVGGD